MDQIAGHITNYRNLRSVVATDPEIKAAWHEIYYYKPGGMYERLREHALPFVPTYFTGIARASLQMRKGMHHYRQYDAILTNASVGLFFSRAFSQVPTMLDFDSTPVQLDQLAGYERGKTDIGLLNDLKFRLTKKKLANATLLQAWSHWAKQSVVEDYGIPAEKVVVNPPGVDLDFWKPLPVAQNELPGRPLRVLFVGGDFRRKGGPLLLEWYEGQDPARCELHIVTKEPVKNRPGIYVYHDMQPNSSRLLNLYQRSDLFVLPSLGECFGIALVEAMGAGLPVIASDVGGTADIVEPGRNGFIVPVSDATALTEAIEAVLTNNERHRAMGRQSRRLAEERFDLGRNARLTLDYLKQIADGATIAKRSVPSFD